MDSLLLSKTVTSKLTLAILKVIFPSNKTKSVPTGLELKKPSGCFI
jgi:hypothetical protein